MCQKLAYFLWKILRVNNSRILTIKNAKFSEYYVYMNLNIWENFQICISVPLSHTHPHMWHIVTSKRIDRLIHKHSSIGTSKWLTHVENKNFWKRFNPKTWRNLCEILIKRERPSKIFGLLILRTTIAVTYKCLK